MANDCIPFYRPGEDVTVQASAAITGKRFIAPSGDRLSGPGLSATAEGSNYRGAHCGAGLAAVGVSMYDCPIGGKVGIIMDGIVPVTAGAALTAGHAVQSDGTGQAIVLASGVKLGVVMTGCSSGADAEIALQLS